MNLENMTIIITGANGLVGIPTIKKCLQENAAHIFAVDINVGKDLKYLAEKYKNRITIYLFQLIYIPSNILIYYFIYQSLNKFLLTSLMINAFSYHYCLYFN